MSKLCYDDRFQEIKLSEFGDYFLKKVNEKIKPCPKCGEDWISFYRRYEDFFYSCSKCKYEESVRINYDTCEKTKGIILPCFTKEAYEIAIFKLLKRWNMRAELDVTHKKTVKWNYNLEEAPYNKRIWVLLEIDICEKVTHNIEALKKQLRNIHLEEANIDWYLESSGKVEKQEKHKNRWGQRPIAWCDFIEPKMPKFKQQKQSEKLI